MSFSRASVALVLVLACLAGSVSATCYFNEFAGQFGVKSGAIFPTQTFGSATNLNGSTFTEFLVDNCATTCDANVQLTIYIYFKDSFEVSINGLTLDTAGAWVSMPQNPLLIGTTTVNPLNSAYHFYVGQDPTQTFNIFTFNYTQWQCPTGTNKVTNIVAFTTTLVGTCTEYETFEIQRQCAAVKGDPVFVGFHGQQYEVHGMPGAVFNLISAQSVQLNARFIFLDSGDALNAGEQLQLHYQAQREVDEARKASTASRLLKALQVTKSASAARELPYTTAWSHPGTYLGEVGVLLRSGETVHSVQVTAGKYQQGFEAIKLNGRPLPLPLPLGEKTVLDEGNATVTLVTPHSLRVSTSEVSFLLVNSDGFLNVDEARLTPLTVSQPERLEGLIGQSADPTRYFPKFSLTTSAPSEVKNDWQQHQMFDYLVQGDDLFSSDFASNKF